VLLTAGCAPKPPSVTVGRILLSLPPQYDDRLRERDSLREQVAARVADTPRVVYAPRDRDATYILSITVEEIIELQGSGDEVRPIVVKLTAMKQGHEFSATGRGLPLIDITASTLTGFDDAWKVIAEQRRLSIAPDAELITFLAHPDRRLRGFAIGELGERRSKEAVDPLCRRLLTEPEQDLVLRTVGALVAIGDPRAAGALIEVAHNQSPELTIQIAYALGALGGPVAEGYLVTLASGHPIDLVRAAAEQALKELSLKPKARDLK